MNQPREKNMNRVLVMMVLVFTALAACAPNQAGQPTAQSSPQSNTPTASISRPTGVRALAVDPRDGRLLQAASDGLYQSRDEGKSWTRISLPSDIATKGVSQVALRKDEPDILYIAGEQVGIWRSRDAGKTWQKTTNGLTSEQVSALAVHTNGYPRDSRKSLFAWVAGVGMFETQDEGDSWKRSVDRGMGLDEQPVLALTHSPLEGSMNTGWLYASTPAGAYLSMD